MIWKVRLTVRRMGMQCQSCKQEFSFEVNANDMHTAIARAKELCDVDLETHQVQINYVREIRCF